jgi:hypothetical protein
MSEIMSGSVRRTSPRRFTLAVWSGVLVLLVLGLASCAKPPEAEMSAAAAAIEQRPRIRSRLAGVKSIARTRSSPCSVATRLRRRRRLRLRQPATRRPKRP